MTAQIKRRVSLRDFASWTIEANISGRYVGCPPDVVRKAINKHMSTRLAYCPIKGKTTNSSGTLAEYSPGSDIPEYRYGELDVILKDQLIPWVNNSISRLMRGHTA